MTGVRLAKYAFGGLLAGWLAVSTAAVYLLTRGDRITHAVVSMGTGLVLLWVFLGGAAMFLRRDRARKFVLALPGNWQVKFVLFATLLALIEEAITTGMTNLAPLFGARVGEAYITASATYLDVVFCHSVIVFIPWFIAWALLLRWWDFKPFTVFLLTGLNGLLAERMTFGSQNLLQFAMWIFVYGLMVYLPAWCVPAAAVRRAKKPRAWHLLPALLLPFVLGIPWALAVNLAMPNHPDIHFPPIRTGN